MIQKIITTEPVIETSVIDPAQYPAKKAVFRAYSLLWYILAVLETLLLFRFILKFIGANPASGFTQFINGASFPFVAPFLGIVGANRAGSSVFEWPVLIAMAVYAVGVWLAVEFILLIRPVNAVEVEEKLESA